jgi:hypothetical protein
MALEMIHMSTLTHLLGNLVGLGATVIAVMTLVFGYIVAASVRKMARPDGLLEVIEDGPEILAEDTEFADRQRWAQRHGFSPDMIADFRGALGGQLIVIATWRSRALKTYLSTYTTPQKVCCEFVTILNNDAALTTTNTRDSLLIPPGPERYLQAFDGLDLDELLRRHQEGLAHLSHTRHLEAINRTETTDRLILDSLRHQMAWVQTLPFWQLRGVWWYWGRRNLLNNKTIAERYPR